MNEEDKQRMRNLLPHQTPVTDRESRNLPELLSLPLVVATVVIFVLLFL